MRARVTNNAVPPRQSIARYLFVAVMGRSLTVLDALIRFGRAVTSL